MRPLLLALWLATQLSVAQSDKKTEAPPPHAAPPITVQITTPPKPEAEIAEENRRAHIQEKANFWAVILTGVIAGAAIVQIIIYRRQARIMADALRISADQAKSAELAALASRQSTDALMNGDRAWISVIPAIEAPDLHPLWEQGDPLPATNPFHHGFPVIIRNVGKTPARIEKVYIQYVLLQHRPNVLPDDPAYIDPLKEQSFLLVPNEETPVLTLLSKPQGVLTKADISGIYSQCSFLYGYGIVKYKDVYGSEHETRFGYVYHFPQGGLVGIEKTGYRRAGPEAYNRQT